MKLGKNNNPNSLTPKQVGFHAAVVTKLCINFSLLLQKKHILSLFIQIKVSMIKRRVSFTKIIISLKYFLKHWFDRIRTKHWNVGSLKIPVSDFIEIVCLIRQSICTCALSNQLINKVKLFNPTHDFNNYYIWKYLIKAKLLLQYQMCKIKQLCPEEIQICDLHHCDTSYNSFRMSSIARSDQSDRIC